MPSATEPPITGGNNNHGHINRYNTRSQDNDHMLYERQKHDGSYPIIGVNTFRNPNAGAAPETIELARSTDAEKQSQLKRLESFQLSHAQRAPALLERLRRTVIENGNTFEVLMDAVRGCSLGQITHTLYDVGGRYRRNM